MELVVDKLIDFSGGKDEELRDISGLGTLLITANYGVFTKFCLSSIEDNHRRAARGWQDSCQRVREIDAQTSGSNPKCKLI
jgi:hypothetical protein